jgi:hypothetical protein
MHVVTTVRRYKDRVYETHLLRRTFRQDGAVRNETLANLSHLPKEAIDAVRRPLRGETLVGTQDAFEITRSLRHGDLVVDPMAGIGSTLVEAVHLGRDAIGVEYEPTWADLARANLAHAKSQGATGDFEVVCGDARHLAAVVDPAVVGLVGLVVTSPPYGASLHGRVTARPGQGIAKSHNHYSTDPANLAHVGLAGLLEAMGTILSGCARVPRPGGYVAMTVRPYWHAGHLVDLPGALVRVGEAAGLVLYERNVALLAGLRDDHLVPRTSFFALEQARKARAEARICALQDLLARQDDELVFLRRLAVGQLDKAS